MGKILPKGPETIEEMLWGGGVTSAVDRMNLYEAHLEFTYMGESAELDWVFKADSDLEAAQKVKQVRETKNLWDEDRVLNCRNGFAACFVENVECHKLVRIVRNLNLRPQETILEKYGEYMTGISDI